MAPVQRAICSTMLMPDGFEEVSVDEPRTLTLELYRGDVEAPIPGFRPVCSFVDNLADAQIAADTAILRQGGPGPIYKCRATIQTDKFCDARVDVGPPLSLLGLPRIDEQIFNHVHSKKQELIDAGFIWVAFQCEDRWVEYIYLQGDELIEGKRVPYEEVREARLSPRSHASSASKLQP